MKKTKKNPLFPGLLVIILILMEACSEIQVQPGPFPIDFEQNTIEGKSKFLKNIPTAGTGDSLPNIIVILVDDLGKHDISSYDLQGVHTQALDRLAQNGIKFSSAYSTCSVCSPSRASLLTGRYQHRFGFERQPMNRYPTSRMEYWFFNHFMNTDPMQLVNPMSRLTKEEIKNQGIPPGEILLSEILQKRGYQTGIFGKWHLGYQESFIPIRRGFDEQYGFYEAFTQYDSEDDPGIINHRHDYFASKHIWKQKRKGTCAIRENDVVVEEEDYLTFSIADRACKFIDKNRNSPFFLYVPFNAPHTPFQVPEEYYDRFSDEKDDNKRVYYGMISALDDAIGDILEKVEEFGLTEKTLIIFASDNGGATYTGATDNGPLKAGKFSQYEGGINIPMIFSWKGVLPGGSVYHHPVSLMDIFTTAMKVAGCELPLDRTIDGVNLLPFTLGDSLGLPHPYLFWRTDFNKAVRHFNWKLVWNDRDNQVFLYDLDSDPSEQRNLAAEHSEKTLELQHKILEWESEMKDPMWPGVMQFQFEIDGDTTWWAI